MLSLLSNKFWGRFDNQDAPVVENKTPIDADDILDVLNDETDDVKDKDKGKEKEKEEEVEEEEEPEEEEEETEEEDEEKEEELEIEDDSDELVIPARKKAIEKDFPGIFKKYPYLETALFKSQQYTELLPTIEDAKEAVDKAEVLDKFEKDVSQGNITEVLKAAKDAGEDAYVNLVDNYMESLASIDKDAYMFVVGNIVKRAIYALNEDGKSNDNEDYVTAAAIMNKYLFDTKEIQAPRRLKNAGRDDESSRIRKERQEFEVEKFNDRKTEVDDRVKNTIIGTIDANIDKNGKMTPFIKRHAAREAKEMLDNAIAADKVFAKTIESLWKQARNNNYSKDSLDKIRAAHLSKAKTLLKPIILKAKSDALKGMGRRQEADRKGPLPVNRHAPASGDRNTRSKKEVPKDMDTLAFLSEE